MKIYVIITVCEYEPSIHMVTTDRDSAIVEARGYAEDWNNETYHDDMESGLIYYNSSEYGSSEDCVDVFAGEIPFEEVNNTTLRRIAKILLTNSPERLFEIASILNQAGLFSREESRQLQTPREERRQQPSHNNLHSQTDDDVLFNQLKDILEHPIPSEASLETVKEIWESRATLLIGVIERRNERRARIQMEQNPSLCLNPTQNCLNCPLGGENHFSTETMRCVSNTTNTECQLTTCVCDARRLGTYEARNCRLTQAEVDRMLNHVEEEDDHTQR